MNALAQPRGAQFTKTIIDLAWYILLVSCVLYASLLTITAFMKSSVTINLIYMLSGLRIGFSMDDALYNLALSGQGVQDAKIHQGSFTLFLANESGGVLIWLGVLASTVKVLVVLSILHNLRLFLQTIIDHRPFVKVNEKRLRFIGWSLVVGFLVLLSITVLHGELALRMIEGQHLDIKMALGESVSVWMFVAGLLFLVVSGAFGYGTGLQVEQDFTI